jgi:hypothetical protein
MNTEKMTTIPYERQSDPQNSRRCGAACLHMVYRSLDQHVPQDEIWPAIAKQNRFGSLASTTHLMAQDAARRGFSALAIQARHPLQALRLCRDAGIRAILNHRPRREATEGHYSVLVDIDDRQVVLHDPFGGPSRRLSYAELLELWQLRFPGSEIVGNVLIGFARQPSALAACQLCRTPIPQTVECPKCKRSVGLQPSALLGCVSSGCMARLWNYLCCPSCDYTWTFSIEPQKAGSMAAVLPINSSQPGSSGPLLASSEVVPCNFEGLFGELDKFCSHIFSLPGTTNRPEIKEHLDFIMASKEKLKLAQAEDLAHRKARQEQLAAVGQIAQQKEEAHRQKMEELHTPSPSLDGNTLGSALLRNMGLIDLTTGTDLSTAWPEIEHRKLAGDDVVAIR